MDEKQNSLSESLAEVYSRFLDLQDENIQLKGERDYWKKRYFEENEEALDRVKKEPLIDYVGSEC